MDESQGPEYCFQTRILKHFKGSAAYIPGMPTMSSPMDKKFESVDRFVSRYNECRNSWEYGVSLGKQEYLGITKENFRKIDGLKIPKGVNKKSLIKPSEDWFEEHPDFRKEWESKMRSLRRGEEIIEAKTLSDAFMNDPDSGMIHVTQHRRNMGSKGVLYFLEPTLESGPSQPVLPPSRAQQSVQPSLNTAGFLLAKPNPNPDLQRHSKLSDDPINPTTYSGMPSQTPDNGNPSSTTPGATTRPAYGDNSSTDGWTNRYP
ncbi:uncharacterized protein EAE97_001470 [Botrytis byssoidea]|uniref:Uncharacterized protein n=1 Tax=Botrytis byssoidea TaxID=139641 RepID=A0A9P5IVA9_9HELO|nr:uncharacterized protein EAE97_001470 [Botrytis byssoidea]KAF7951973.1 hypothetical protein EAE97_001470 [Botrytis byssoidea]